MKLCITGPSGAGKTTLATLISGIAPHLSVICGDSFIHRNSDELPALITKLKGTRSYVFEHVSALKIMLKAGIVPDFTIFLNPNQKNGTDGSPPETSDEPLPSNNEELKRQLASARSAGIPHVMGSCIREVLNPCVDLLRRSVETWTPITNFLIKVSSRCNLDCSYCYMYQGQDRDWPANSRFIASSTGRKVGERIAEYAKSRRLPCISVIFHGGEPLSLSATRFSSLVRAVQEPLADVPNVRFSVQTNGTLINDRRLRLMDDLGLSIGISLDGGDANSNRFRKTHSGKNSFDRVEVGLRACVDFPFVKGRFGGVLCVVNPGVSGRDAYRYFRKIGISGVDFLLRDKTHDFEPGGVVNFDALPFLIDAFDEWIADQSICKVPLFESIVAHLLGYSSGTDAVGLAPANLLGIGVDGNWELLDLLRICFEGAWKTPLNVFSHSIEEVHQSSAFSELLKWQYDLSESCLSCEALNVCGGGYLPHRYSASKGFRNPSAHCKTLYGLIEHISATLRTHVGGFHQRLTYAQRRRSFDVGKLQQS